jgi:hypothetical protein
LPTATQPAVPTFASPKITPELDQVEPLKHHPPIRGSERRLAGFKSELVAGFVGIRTGGTRTKQNGQAHICYAGLLGKDWAGVGMPWPIQQATGRLWRCQRSAWAIIERGVAIGAEKG